MSRYIYNSIYIYVCIILYIIKYSYVQLQIDRLCPSPTSTPTSLNHWRFNTESSRCSESPGWTLIVWRRRRYPEIPCWPPPCGRDPLNQLDLSLFVADSARSRHSWNGGKFNASIFNWKTNIWKVRWLWIFRLASERSLEQQLRQLLSWPAA